MKTTQSTTKWLLVLILAIYPLHSSAGQTIYVDANATDANNGSSWADAYTGLQLALDNAGPGDQIWVAVGTYKPTSDYGLGIGDRGRHFQMKNGVTIYGGFAGTETALYQRDVKNNKTILSGDIGTPDETSDNCYHVFYHPSGLILNGTAILDGFTITAGNANEPSNHNRGGGMYNYSNSPAVTNCTFTGNTAIFGGGMCNYIGSCPAVTNCTFTGNTAYYGGGMDNHTQCNPVVTNCTFTGNTATYYGGGMRNFYSSSPTLTNCTFGGNSATSQGGGMCNHTSSSPGVTNCIFWGNIASTGPQIYNYDNSSSFVAGCDIEGGWIGLGNINSDPLFADANGPDDILGTLDDNLRLLAGSPCIDKGFNVAVPPGITIDLDGNPRITDGDTNGPDVDMGAYEYQPPADPCASKDKADFNCDGIVDLDDFAYFASRWLSKT